MKKDILGHLFKKHVDTEVGVEEVELSADALMALCDKLQEFNAHEINIEIRDNVIVKGSIKAYSNN